MTKAGAVALLCSAAALLGIMGLSGLDAATDGAGSSSATGVIGVGDGPNGSAGNGSGSNGDASKTGGTTSATNSTGASRSGTSTTLTPGSTVGSSSATIGTAPTSVGTGIPGTAAPGPTVSNQPVNPTTSPQDQGPFQTSRCTDTTGDRSIEGLGDIDLVEVTLRRSASNLTVRFGLGAPITVPAANATPSMSSWQVLMAQGDDVLYAFTVSEVEGAWETSLVDFASPTGDRFGAMAPASGAAIEVSIPRADLPRLPARFTWWATSLTDRLVPQGLFANDDCPPASGVNDAGLALPPESRRASFS